MRLQALTVLVFSCALVTYAAGQAGETSAKPLGHAIKPGKTTELPATAESVKPSDAVITMSGACKGISESGCVSAVSREQFEQMANSIKPGMTTDARRNFAIQYGKILSFADQARALGLENEPRFKDILQYVRDQLLVESLQQYYSDQYSKVSDQKIEEYYKENSRKFMQADLQRVLIPSQPAAAEITKPTPEEEKAYVEKVRQEWVGGADPAKLQKEALSRMGLNGSVPDVNLKDHTPGMLPQEQQSVFDLKPGEISQPFTDAGASYLYKMVSEGEKPLSDVKAQIAKTLHDQMMREKIQELSENGKPVLNEAYFGPEKKPGPESGAGQEGAEPSAKSNPSQPVPPQK